MRANCRPQVYFDCIFGMPPAFFDGKILFYPFEKYLNLPPVFIQISNFESRYFKIVGQKNGQFIVVGIIKLNRTQFLRAQLL